MHNAPTVFDSLWFDNLSTAERQRLGRLFNINPKLSAECSDEAYARGYKAGVVIGHIEMLREVRLCTLCAEYGVRKCDRHKK